MLLTRITGCCGKGGGQKGGECNGCEMASKLTVVRANSVSIGDVTCSEPLKSWFPLLCKSRGFCGAMGNDASRVTVDEGTDQSYTVTYTST